MDPIFKEKLAKYIPPKEKWTPVDEAWYTYDNPFNIPKGIAEKLRLNALKYAFRHHYENNKFYHEYCKSKGVKPDDINKEEDLFKIPLIPSSFFKDHPEDNEEIVKWLKAIYTGELPDVEIKNSEGNFYDVFDAYLEKGIRIMTSSGTSGRFTVIAKDKITHDRYAYAFLQGVRIAGLSPNSYAIVLGPEPFKNTIPFAYTPAFLQLLCDDVWHMKGRMPIFDKNLSAERAKSLFAPNPEEILQCMEIAKSRNQPVLLWGIPASIDMLLSWIKKEKGFFPLSNKSVVIMGGGRKGMGRADITTEEIVKGIKEVFGLPVDRFTEFYGLDEANILGVTCKQDYHYVHLLPYSAAKVFVLDEEMKPLPYGEEGRYAILGSGGVSFPEFIATEDKVTLLEHCPECDLPGPVIAGGISRMPGAEERGCAVAIAKVLKESRVKAEELGLERK